MITLCICVTYIVQYIPEHYCRIFPALFRHINPKSSYPKMMSFLTVLVLYPGPLAVKSRLRLSSKRTHLVQQRQRQQQQPSAAGTEAQAWSSPGSERDAPGPQRQAAPLISASVPRRRGAHFRLRGHEEGVETLLSVLQRKLPHSQIWEYRNRWWGEGGGGGGGGGGRCSCDPT